MIAAILFQNSDLLWPVVSISLLLWMIFVWKEWTKPIKNRFYLTATISLITVLSIALMALKPLDQGMAPTNVGVLVTNGFNQNRLDSLKKEVKGVKIIRYKKNLPIGETLDSLNTLIVLGDGVQPYDFWQFENRLTIYLGSEIPDGIINLKYDQRNISGEDLKITGRYHNTKASNWLVLHDTYGQGLDSTMLDSEVIQDFELTTPLKAEGTFVYELVEKDSLGEIVSSEPLPHTVLARTNLKILLINGFPTFETKYLKNYLSEMDHELIVRSQLTRGRYKFEYFNTKKNPVYRLGEKELQNFDLLVMDGGSVKNLSGNDWSAVETVIKNEGLGLFVQPEFGLFGRSSERLGLKFERDGISKTALNEFPKLSLEKFPFKFRKVSELELIHSSNKKPLAAYTRVGQGRIGTTSIQNTYQLWLDGKTVAYRRFWADIVNKLAKTEKSTSEWEVKNTFPLENHPFEFELRTKIDKPEVFSEGRNQISLKQSIDISSLWMGTLYPKHQGWNRLHLDGELHKALEFYVIDTTAWRALRSNILKKENNRYFDSQPKELEAMLSTKPIHPFWFFLVGLFGLAYLWLHPKLFQN